MCLATSGCVPYGAPDAGAADSGPATRPATKATCKDVDWVPPDGIPLQQTSRELVDFSPTLLGVQTTWSGDGFTAQTIAGGYVDDLTEPYDDLHLVRTIPRPGGADVDVLEGGLLQSPVLFAVWQDTQQDVPCDVRALVVTGADAPTQDALLRGLR